MRMLTSNIGWKLLALVSSIALWYLYAGETEVATSLPVIVQYRNIPPDLELNVEQPERLFMKLRGPSSRLSPADLAGTVVELDLSNVNSPGEQTFSITEENLRLPTGVELLRVVPSQIRVGFEKPASRYVPVDVRYSGPPEKGYRIVAQTVVPSAVRVVGPENRLARIESVMTDEIDLNSTVGSAEFRVPVYVNDPQLRFDPAAPVATVRVTLEKIPQE